MSETPQAIDDCHELIRWLIPILDKFPRNRRYTLGVQLETILLEVLDGLVDAAYSKKKQAPLARSNRRLQVVRHLWRVCFELHMIPMKRFKVGAEKMVNLGNQIGGWLRSCERR